MNAYTITSLSASALCLGLAVIALTAKRKSKEAVPFGISSALIGCWSMFPFLMSLPIDSTSKVFITRWLYTAATFVPPSFWHMYFIVLGLHEKRDKWMLGYMLAVSFPLIWLTWQPWYIKGIVSFGPSYVIQPGPAYVVFVVHFLTMGCYGVLRMMARYRSAQVDNVSKNKAKYLFLSFGTALCGASIHFTAAYARREPLPHDFFIIIFVCFLAYAILQHRLMDIDIIIRRTLVYSVLTTILTMLFLSVAALSAHFLGGWMKFNAVLSSVIAAGIVSIFFNPLRTRIQHFVDKRFFRDAVDREEKLYELSREILEQKSPEAVAGSLLGILEEALHPKRAALYLRAAEGGEFKRASATAKAVALDEDMADGNLWARYFSHYGQPVLRHVLSSYAGNPHQELLEAAAGEMKRLEVVAVFPLISHGDLLGYLMLGERKSEEPYTNDDLLLLRNAANQTALAYERYLLDKGLKEAPEALKVMTGRFVHEIKTPMSNIHMPANVMLMYLEALESGKCSLAEVLPQFRKQLEYIREQSLSASERIEAIRQMSKQQKDDYVPLSAGELIRGSLSSLDQLISRSKVSVAVEVQEHLPLILGHRQQLEIVFMNLAKNGIEAMTQDKDSSRPKVLRVQGREERDFIVITVEDTGPGIAPENVNRLFQSYFSTKGTAGTGVGLFLAQEVIKGHGGSVDVRSEVGKGTAFVVRLPKYAKAA